MKNISYSSLLLFFCCMFLMESAFAVSSAKKYPRKTIVKKFQQALKERMLLQQKEAAMRTQLLPEDDIRILETNLVQGINPHLRGNKPYSLFEEALVAVLATMSLRYKKYLKALMKTKDIAKRDSIWIDKKMDRFLCGLLGEISDYIAQRKGSNGFSYINISKKLDRQLLKEIHYLNAFFPAIKQFKTMFKVVNHIRRHYIDKQDQEASLILQKCACTAVTFLPYSHPEKLVLINSLEEKRN